MRVIVSYDESCNHSEHEDREWGSWSESWDFSVTGVGIANDEEKTCYSEEGFLVADGADEVHVLSMHYGTGDSFGHADGRGVVLGAWADRQKAEQALTTLEANTESYSIKVTDDFDREIQIYNPGAGYFESISQIDLETFALTSKGSGKITKRFN